jgi:ferredoxin
VGRSRWAYDLLIRAWPLGKVLNRLGNWPLLGPLLQPCFDSGGNRAVIIPVQEAVRGTESVVLPLPLLRPLVEQAGVRFRLDACLCRQGEGCRDYPRDIGCLFLGPGAAEINLALGRPVSVEEALAHARQAVEAGLVPLVVHSSFDAWMLGVPYRRVLAICFCCDCCCSVRQGLRLGPPAFWETVTRLPGLEVTVGRACTGCGTCLDLCHVGAISLAGGRAWIAETCKGCGRCAAACPQGAIDLRLAEGADPLAGLLAQFSDRTEIGEGQVAS